MKSRFEREAEIKCFYDSEVAEEDRRLDDYPFEFAVTMRFVAKYLHGPRKILDAACGTGRYAEALLSAGFTVGASDLSDANVRRTRERLAGEDKGLLFARQGNALDASSYSGGPWDGILLLGPCYHMPELSDRISLLSQAREHLAPEGWLFVSFVSRSAAFWWGLMHNPDGILEKDATEALLAGGIGFNFAPPGKGLPNSYFCDPGELTDLFERAGLKPRHICGTEGVFGGRVSQFHSLAPRVRGAWFDFVIAHCEAPTFRWNSEHLLVVAQSR